MRLNGSWMLGAWLALAPIGHARPVPSSPDSSLKQADADYRAGSAALSRNDLKIALADFQNVVRLAPTAEQGHSALGAVLVRLGRTGEGIRELEKSLAMKPGDASAQMYLALAYQQNVVRLRKRCRCSPGSIPPRIWKSVRWRYRL